MNIGLKMILLREPPRLHLESFCFQEWAIHDCKSLNGITVNGEPIGEDGRTLRHGDVVNFGKRTNPPEFEFVFEAPYNDRKHEKNSKFNFMRSFCVCHCDN